MPSVLHSNLTLRTPSPGEMWLNRKKGGASALVVDILPTRDFIASGVVIYKDMATDKTVRQRSREFLESYVDPRGHYLNGESNA